jgi:23S rRNA (adenine2503-C2)-methyltransferase
VITHPIPTGYLFVDEYEGGQLETLSIGDYGKEHNVKADFLGYENRIDGVPCLPCMPLQNKWVVTTSTQYGCPMKCTFCDVPNVKFKGNVSFEDLKKQLYSALALFPEVGYTERLNLHYARMGEPIFNDAVFDLSIWLHDYKRVLQSDTGVRVETLHPVLTTSLPRKLKDLVERIHRWCSIKNNTYNGQAGLQFSINSTDEGQREEMFGGQALTLKEFAEIADRLPSPVSRKYCLNFAYSTQFEIDSSLLSDLFDREKFMVKITPIHNNNACNEHGIETVGGYDSWHPYQQPEEDLRAQGWDVLVFIPSLDEEDGLVTCGNAVLGGGEMKSEGVINIKGIVR